MSAYRTWVRAEPSGAISELVRGVVEPVGGGWREVDGPLGSLLAQPGAARRHFVADGKVQKRAEVRLVADRMVAKVNEAIVVKADGASGKVAVLVGDVPATMVDGVLSIVWDTATGVTVRLDDSESALRADPLHLRWE